MQFRISGNATVATLKRRFLEEIGVAVRVYGNNSRMANDSDTISAVRLHKPKTAEIEISGRAKLTRVHQLFEEQLGLSILILRPDGGLADEDATLAATRRLFIARASASKDTRRAFSTVDEHPEYPRRNEELAEAIVCLYLHLACQCGNPNDKITDILGTIMMWYKGLGIPDWDEIARVDFNAGAIAFNEFMTRDDFAFVSTSLVTVQEHSTVDQCAEVLRSALDIVPASEEMTPSAMAVVCQMADAWGHPIPRGMHRPNNDVGRIEDCSLRKLVDSGVMFNLYGNIALWGMDESDFSRWDAEEPAGTYRHHLYGCVFTGAHRDEVMEFLNMRIGARAVERVFLERGHAPAIGIYNAMDNSLIGIGLGRKDQMFVVTSEESIDEDDLGSTFCRLDHGGIVHRVIASVEAAGDINGYAMQHEDHVERDEICEEADEELAVVRRLIPTLPETVCEISPGDY